MIGQLWNFLKIGFKFRLCVCSIVFLGISFFGMAPTPFLKSLFLLITLPFMGVMAGITAADTINKFTDIIRMQFKKGVKIPIPDEIQALADAMGVKIKEVKVVPDMLNAGVYPNGKVVIGDKILTCLDKKEFLAVFAHEFSHLKRRHHVKRMVALFGILSLGIIVFINVPGPFQVYAIFAFLSIVMIPINWRFEFEADDDGKKYIGTAYMASTLQKISEGKNLNEASETHPPIKRRIEKLYSG
ncbi:MAG TPA: M48 family metalloprotease [Methanoregulaceae archaeon]|nr:M48 family metalloprotease [Methanoregulaceae archaeon]